MYLETPAVAMTGDDDAATTEVAEVRVPEPLAARAESLFVRERGYEPASFQEALGVVLDLADDGSLPSESDRAESAGGRSSNGAEPTDADSGADTGASDDSVAENGAPASSRATSPAVEPDDDSVSFDTYVDGLEANADDGPSPSVESILDTEHADGVVQELAAEVLDEMTRDAFQELEHGVDEGVAGVTDGHGGTQAESGGETAPSGTTGDGVPDSLTADPESDCAICGTSHRVSVLQTTILDEDGSVALVCPSCTD